MKYLHVHTRTLTHTQIHTHTYISLLLKNDVFYGNREVKKNLFLLSRLFMITKTFLFQKLNPAKHNPTI